MKNLNWIEFGKRLYFVSWLTLAVSMSIYLATHLSVDRFWDGLGVAASFWIGPVVFYIVLKWVLKGLIKKAS